jgi:hypothetical protein
MSDSTPADRLDPQPFWAWFLSNLARLEAMADGPDDELLDAIEKQLHRFSTGLWFEVGSPGEGKMEFVVTAEGDSDYFDAVRTLCDAAPAIPGWIVTPFKPPAGFDFSIAYEGIDVDPAECWFKPLLSKKAPGRMALHVGVAGLDDADPDDLLNALRLMVECGLGELVAAERIAYIETRALPEIPADDGFRPLASLPEYVAQLSRQSDS